MKAVMSAVLLLLLSACIAKENCQNEPYYVHARHEADIKMGDKGVPLSDVQLGAGCDNKSVVVHKTIPFDSGK